VARDGLTVPDISIGGVDVLGLVVGSLLIAVGVGTALNLRGFAADLHRYYNSIPDPRWRPRWLPWQFRPTLWQATVVASMFVLVSLGMGITFVLASLL